MIQTLQVVGWPNLNDFDTTCSLAFDSTVTSGSLLVALVSLDSYQPLAPAAVHSVSDNINGAWTEAKSLNYFIDTWGESVSSVWYFNDPSDAGNITITANFGNS